MKAELRERAEVTGINDVDEYWRERWGRGAGKQTWIAVAREINKNIQTNRHSQRDIYRLSDRRIDKQTERKTDRLLG